ncbi:MAG: tyrosine--tRNA ligase [Polyangiaceae bacterium]
MNVDQQIQELLRGTVELHQLDELKSRLSSGRPLRVKAGFDPTRPDLHLGHTVLMNKMRQFQDFGHQVIFIIGDFTAMLGDPTGQNEARPRLTKEQVMAAAKTYQEQAFLILDREKTVVRYNSEWLSNLSLEQVLELAAKRTLARTLERRDFRERFETQRDIYLHEFFYPLLQGYDSVALEADIELGGTDQLFNLMVGRDLQQRYGQTPQMVMTVPILEGLDAKVVDGQIVGKKMSKSADNYIGVMEPPLTQYRKCMQIDDTVIWRFYDLLSRRTRVEIDELRATKSPLEAKALFAFEIVERFHGKSSAEEAEQSFRSAYLSDGLPADIPELTLTAEGEGLFLFKALSQAGLVKSTSDGKRLIQQGGVEVDSQRISDEKHVLGKANRYLLRVGSKNRKFCYVTVK